MKSPAAALLVIAALARSASAISPEQEKLAQQGLDLMYHNDYSGAETLFKNARQGAPQDPLYALGYAVAAWWRMETVFALAGSPEEAAFKAAVEDAIKIGKSAADRDKSAEARLYLATAFGLRGRRRAANKHWLGAYLDGRRAYKEAQRALELDGQLVDANFGLGAFNYYLATLSGLVRALTFTAGGDRAGGLRQLELAAAHGRFSSVPAKLVLVGIDWTFEKKPEEAWKLLEEVRQVYPDSPLVKTMLLAGRFHLRDVAGLEKDAREFLAAAESGARYFQPIDRVVGRSFVGLARQLAGDPASALKEYRTALAELPPNHRVRSALNLFIGEALDLQGLRKDALAAYEQALKEPPLWGVPRFARHLLAEPFKPSDNPLPSRKADL